MSPMAPAEECLKFGPVVFLRSVIWAMLRINGEEQFGPT